MKICFNHPAKNWDEALPIENGRLGAMIFGGVISETFNLMREQYRLANLVIL